MEFRDTTATKKIFKLNKRIRAVSGGTSSSKTISILVWLIDYSQSTRNKKVDIVSESFPHLDMGAIQDFKNIMQAQGYWNEARWHDTKHIYTFETGTRMHFFSVDTLGKAHGPRRDVLFVNECNNLSYNIVDQLITRTREIVWLDWNPSVEFWFYTEMLPHRDDIDFMGDGGSYAPLTYKDNEALWDEPDHITIKEIESHKHNKAWWQVYGLGHLGDVEGKIYTGWRKLNKIPEGAKFMRFWTDFGYSKDPASIGSVYKWNSAFILDELAYQRGMSNEAIATVITNHEEGARGLDVCDSSEPKSIDELKEYGVNAIPAVKGPDSVNYGIATVQDQKIYITSRSVKTIKEYRQYQWKTDRNGKQLDVPEDGFDHSMDGIRYAITSIIKPEKKSTVVTRTKQYVGPNRTSVPRDNDEHPGEMPIAVRRSTSVFRQR
jgi:phage terminase large subunit